ncbi:MAG: NUDIX hydrolase [Planctomycetota bacterium]|jgi:8-oxo-dGTP pyrophosphatase MutT (NUDIX family)
MPLQPWEELGDRQLAKFKVFTVREATRRSPRNGRETGMFVVDTADWVNIVAITRDDLVILVNQWRQGSRAFSLEIPGGIVDPGEEPMAAAARELREETGYQAGEIRQIGEVNPNPALFSNRCSTFLASDCERVGEIQMDAGEDLEVITMPLDEVERRVQSGEIHNAVVMAGLYLHKTLKS